LFKQIYIPCDRGAYIIDAQSIGKREREKKISFLEDEEEERKKREGDPRQRIHARARKRIKHNITCFFKATWWRELFL